MYILNIARATKKMSVNEIKDFIFDNYYKRIRFSNENSYYSMKRLKKKDLLLLANKLIEYLILTILRNTTNHLLEKNPHKISEQSKIITYRSKNFKKEQTFLK